MTHEAKNPSDEKVNKIVDEIIAENQNLLKKLEVEEKTEMKQENVVIGSVLPNVLEVTIKGITENTAVSSKPLKITDYRTLQKSKLELSAS